MYVIEACKKSAFHGFKMAAEELKIPVPWGHIAAKSWEVNSDCPKVLGLHGFADNANTFDKIVPLVKDVNWVCVDFPGHGRSSHRPAGMVYNLTDYVVDVSRVVKALKWSKFSIVGHSMGGGVGILFAAVFPDLVDKIILLDSFGPFTKSANRFTSYLRDSIQSLLKLEDDLHEGHRYTFDGAVKRLLEANPSLTDESARILLERGSRQSGDSWTFTRDPRLKLKSSLSITNEQVMNAISNLKCEVHLIRAKYGLMSELSKDWKESVDKLFSTITSACSKHSVVEVEGNHFVHLNKPEAVTDYINLFLEDNAKL